MSFCRTIRILPLMLLGLSAFATATPASAKTFLEELQGSWRGLGTIHHKGSNPHDDPIACRIKAKFHAESDTLSLKGRCGSVSLTSSFSSTLRENAKGYVTGTPILQTGSMAKIDLEGQAEPTRLRLQGTDGTNEVFISFFLTEENKFQTISGRNKGVKKVNEIVINWKKQ